MEFLQTADEAVTVFCQSLYGPVQNAVAVFFTYAGDYGLIWLFLAALLFFTKDRKTAAVAIAALIINLILNNLILKNLIDRPRPFELIEGIKLLIPRPIGSSMPSAHTSSSFAACTVIVYYCKRERKAITVITCVFATLISLSRIYLCVHYMTDVLCGTITGAICGVLCIAAAHFLLRKYPRLNGILYNGNQTEGKV